MNWFRRLRVVARKNATSRDLDDEFQFHIEHQIAENLASGMDPREARLAALREFGGTAALKDECRSARGVDWLEDAVQDWRYSWRSCRRNPGFALAVIALIAVGIGASTAVFSVVDRVLFAGLPYADAGRLASLGIRIPWLEHDFLTVGTFLDLRRNPGPLKAVTAWAGVTDCDVTGDRPARLGCAQVDAEFLPVLGIRPALGRNFTREEDLPNGPRAALISNALWKSRFGGSRDAVGQRIALDGHDSVVVGVLPPEFESPTLDPVDVLVPLSLPASAPPGAQALRVIGRLRDGVTIAQARDSLLGQTRSVMNEVPPFVRPQAKFHMRSLRELQTGDFRAASWTLLAASLAMLAIACANAANLLIARSLARRRELAIRAALGAGTSRMARQTLAESLMLCLAGGAAGCGLAYFLPRLFVAIAPAGIPHLNEASLDPRAMLFCLGASLVCGLGCGLAPALHSPGLGILRGGRSAGRMSLTARRILVGAQLAVSLVLLTCAGALLQSLWNQERLALGMNPERVVTAQLALGSRYAEATRRAAFYDQLEERLKRIPGVEAVALSDSLPPGGVPRSQPIYAPEAEGRPALDPARPGIVVWRTVTPEYFRTLGIPILRGRPFTEADRKPNERAMIISAQYARALFGNEDPIGRRICRVRGNPTVWYTVVGVAADAGNAGLTDHNDAEYYLVRRRGAYAWEDAPPVSAALVRGGAANAALESWLLTEIQALDPALPVDIRPFSQHVGALAARPRFQAWLLALFAGVGLLLAALGLYGLASFLVTLREREFGVRLALGATPGGIVRLALADALRWTAGGLVFGLAGSAAASRALRSLLFHVSPADPAAYLAAAALLAAMVLPAALAPARRAARVDPATALRHE
jgi:putative ABC transport system permease protein